MQLTIREPGSAITHFIGCLMALIAASPLLIKAHGNVNDGRKPFRTGDPESFDNDSCHCNSPYKSQKGISNSAA